ncbi:MAG: hypothetical protein JXA28_02840, partial [Bacteroidetes bacterium]|nr:hypothetical protein [Bacteroidota bacterium]
ALHFRISRADGQGAGYRVIGTVPARGTTNEPAWYEFVDALEGVSPSTPTLWYRLEEIATDGSVSDFPAVSVEMDAPPGAEKLEVFPQPLESSAGSCRLRWVSPIEQSVILRIHDVLGRRISSPQRHVLPAGSSVITLPLPGLRSGVFFLEAAMEDGTRLRKRVLVR